MFYLTVQNPRSQNECSQHHKGFLDPESGILDPLGVICSKTEAWGSSFQIPVRVHTFIITAHREDLFIIESLRIQLECMILEHSPLPLTQGRAGRRSPLQCKAYPLVSRRRDRREEPYSCSLCACTLYGKFYSVSGKTFLHAPHLTPTAYLLTWRLYTVAGGLRALPCSAAVVTGLAAHTSLTSRCRRP